MQQRAHYDRAQEMAIHELIFLALATCCAVLFFCQMVRNVRPEITIEKLVAAGLIAGWLILMLVLLCLSENLITALLIWCGLILTALIPLGLIWFGDELGALTGLHYGMVDRPSPGYLVRVFGWLSLIVLVGLSAAVAFRQMLSSP